MCIYRENHYENHTQRKNDYQPDGRELKFKTSVGEQKLQNKHIKVETTQEQFVQMREQRDRTLSAPRLLLPSIQFNIQAGLLPPKESNGSHYLKIPLKLAKPDIY